MAIQLEPVSRPWRRYLRFSVRGLIVLVLVIGGWLGWLVRSARVQRDSVRAIERGGGFVRYDWDGPGVFHDEEKTAMGTLGTTKPWVPRWLVDRIGIHYFGHVTEALLAAPQDAPVLQHVAQLSDLQHLHIYWSNVGDAQLVHLEALTNLSSLTLRMCPVTDAGLLHLKGLTKLKKLDLRETNVTDLGVNELKRSLPYVAIIR